jgi:hypothetical protein
MIGFTEIKCGQCGERWCLDTATYETLQRSSATFHCPWGHLRHFPQGESEMDKLRRERDRLKQDAARLEEWARLATEARDRADRQAAAARGQVTRLKNRAAAGVCPCCNRSFENLRRHMAVKHKGFALEAAAPKGVTVQ